MFFLCIHKYINILIYIYVYICIFTYHILGRVTTPFLNSLGICVWEGAVDRDDLPLCPTPPCIIIHVDSVARFKASKQLKEQNAAALLERRNLAADHARPEFIEEQKRIRDEHIAKVAAEKLEAATVLRAEKLMTALALKKLKKNEQLEINRTAKAHYDSLNEEEKAAVDNDKKEEKESQKALKETSRLLKATKAAKKIEDANRVVEAAKAAKEAKENEDARLLLG